MTKVEITPQNLAAHEWMGLFATVSASTDSSRVGISGRMVAETKNTLTLETKKGEKTIPKSEVTLKVNLENAKGVMLETSKWCYRPEDRIKIFVRKRGGKNDGK